MTQQFFHHQKVAKLPSVMISSYTRGSNVCLPGTDNNRFVYRKENFLLLTKIVFKIWQQNFLTVEKLIP